MCQGLVLLGQGVDLGWGGRFGLVCEDLVDREETLLGSFVVFQPLLLLRPQAVSYVAHTVLNY